MSPPLSSIAFIFRMYFMLLTRSWCCCFQAGTPFGSFFSRSDLEGGLWNRRTFFGFELPLQTFWCLSKRSELNSRPHFAQASLGAESSNSSRSSTGSACAGWGGRNSAFGGALSLNSRLFFFASLKVSFSGLGEPAFSWGWKFPGLKMTKFEVWVVRLGFGDPPSRGGPEGAAFGSLRGGSEAPPRAGSGAARPLWGMGSRVGGFAWTTCRPGAGLKGFSMVQIRRWTFMLSELNVLPQIWHFSRAVSLYSLKASLLSSSRSFRLMFSFPRTLLKFFGTS